MSMRTSHPAVVAQHLINDVIERNIGDFGVYRHAPQLCRDVLGDIRWIARRLLTEPEPRVLEQLVPSDILIAHRDVRLSKRGRGSAPAVLHPGWGAPADAATAAVGSAGALSILSVGDIESAGALLRELLIDIRAQGKSMAADRRVAREATKTPVLKAVELSALEHDIGPLRQLSYRIGAAVAQKSSRRRTMETASIASVPTMLWQAWSQLIAPPQVAQRMLRPTLSAAVLIVGSKGPLSQQLEELRSPLSERSAKSTLLDLSRFLSWPNIRAALIRLHDQLADHPPPIDYTRRRTLDYRNLLNGEQWLDICTSNWTWPSADRYLTAAQLFLYERISGMPGAHANYEWSNKLAVANARKLLRHLTPELVGALNAHAEAFLRSRGIAAEPVDWHPDVRLVDDLELPGRQNMEIDIAALHHLIREEGLSIKSCAERLGSTVHHVSYILSTDPAPATLRR
ncbi:hypothetical protein [Mycolicibacterium porcinum]|uniref:hypothetical protein n=1 Tax=Mycolicibacterium porcinum TaxID=39693 RepID=UPI00257D2C6A|nr:hypothetical protein [Mycolicibacterium porcinum]